MKTKMQKKQEKLFEAIESQYGYFTAKQAEAAGYLITNFPYHVKTGAWIREGRGIYRFRNFPISRLSHYFHYLLWSRNRKDEIQGVYSHETALSLYELSDVNPSKIHMTVPKAFRKWAKTPGVLKLYYNHIPAKDIGSVEGVRVTKPLRTLLDVIQTQETSLEFVGQAFKEALTRGLIRYKELQSEKLPQEARSLFDRWLKALAKKKGA